MAPDAGWLRRCVFATDHKIIGIQFLFMGLAFFIAGGLLAIVMRWQLGWPGSSVPILGGLSAACDDAQVRDLLELVRRSARGGCLRVRVGGQGAAAVRIDS